MHHLQVSSIGSQNCGRSGLYGRLWERWSVCVCVCVCWVREWATRPLMAATGLLLSFSSTHHYPLDLGQVG